MSQYIETKIRYDKVSESGEVKKTTDSYLVDALSFTEAEGRIIEETKPFISGEFAVYAVMKTNIAEVFRDGSGRWYKCKLNFITIDERTAKEKHTANYILVEAPDFHNALENLLDGLKGTMADFEIAAITETAYIDVYDHNAKEDVSVHVEMD